MECGIREIDTAGLEPPTQPFQDIVEFITGLMMEMHEVSNSSIEVYFRRSYYMLDILMSEIKECFSENPLSVLSTLKALLLEFFSCTEPKVEHLTEVLSFYGDDLKR